MRPGASESQMAAFEQKYGVRLPADLRDYFETVNGFDLNKTGWCDGNCFSFFALEEVVPLSDEWWKDPDGDHYFILVDFLISSHVYAIHLGDNPESESPVFVAYSKDRPIRIAESFSEFVEGYLKGDSTILVIDNANRRRKFPRICHFTPNSRGCSWLRSCRGGRRIGRD